MNNLNNKEKQFKEILEGIEYDLDTSIVWSDIKSQLPLQKEDKKSPFWLFLTIGISLLTMSSFVTYTYINAEVSTEIVEQIEFIKVADSEVHQFATYIQDTESSTTSITEIVETAKANNTETENRSSLIENNNTLNQNNNLSIQDKSSYSIENQIVSENNINLSNYTNPIVSNDAKDVVKEHSTSDLAGGLVIPKTQNNLISNNLLNISSVPSLSSFLTSTDPIIIENPTGYSKVIEPISYPYTSQFFLSMNAGINYGFAQNQVVNSSDFDPSKFNNESARIGYSHDLIFGIENRNGWILGGGLSYNTQFFNYQNQSTETYQTVEQGTINNHIESNGSVTTTSGDVTVTNTSAYDLSWNRRHKFVDVTAMIGKRIFLLNQLSIVADLDIAYNIHASHSGYYYSELSGDIEKFTPSDDNPYATNNGLSTGVGIGIDHSIQQFNIGLKSSYNFNPNNLLQDGTFYKTNNNLIKLQLGLSYFPGR